MMMIMIVAVTVIVMMSMTDASDDDDDDDNMSLDPVIPSFLGGGGRGFNKFLKQTAKTAK